MIAKLKSLEVEGIKQEDVVEPECNSSSLEYVNEMDKVVDAAMNNIY